MGAMRRTGMKGGEGAMRRKTSIITWAALAVSVATLILSFVKTCG